MRKVLVAVDVQKGFVKPSSAHIVQPLEKLQHAFDRVIYTRFFNPDPSPFRRILGYEGMSIGSEDIELALNARSDATIVDKPNYSGCNDELKTHLALLNVQEVYVAGIATEACVMKTVSDLFEQDIVPWVIADLCASDKDHRFHDMGISIIASLINTKHVINSAVV